jgi:CheY-like chemotaxis protein
MKMSSAANRNEAGTPSGPIVVVVEDDPITRKAVGRNLQKAGYEVILVSSAADALQVAQRMSFHVLVLDLHLVDGDMFDSMRDGLSVLDWLRRQLGELRFRIVIYTSETGQHLLERAEKSGVFAFATNGVI